MPNLLGVRRTTVTPTMSKLRAAGAIRSDRRGFVEIDRARLTAWRANARRRCSAGSIACTARNCPRRNLPLRRSGKAPSSPPTKPALNSKPLCRKENSGSAPLDQLRSGQSKSNADSDCASSSASSRSTFATSPSSLRVGPGFNRRASIRKSLACSSQVDVSVWPWRLMQ